MRAWVLASACALWVGGCLYPQYSVTRDGGAAGGGGSGGSAAVGRGGSAGTAAGGGPGGSIVGAAGGPAGRGGSAGGTGGSAGSAGTTGAGGSSGGTGGTAGVVGGAGGTGGGAAGRGGTTGVSGAGGAAGRGGSGGGPAGAGGAAAGRGGTSGRGGSNAGTGGGTGGLPTAPSWLPSISVVYQFDMDQGFIGVDAHGNEALHLEEQGNLLPTLDKTLGIEAYSVKLSGPLNNPTYLQSPGGTGLPSVFQTEPSNSWTTGGWFHITATSNQQWLIHDEGPTNFQQGGFIFYVDQQKGPLSTGHAFAYCRVGVSLDESNASLSNYKEVSTYELNGVGNLGFDANAAGWVHLVCRYNATTSELTIFAGGVQAASDVDTTHQVKSGPGPFMLGCNESGYCAFIGNMDEVFWTTSALSDLDIHRIYACGIDGSRCTCSGTDYSTCGFASATGCGSLPACNAATP